MIEFKLCENMLAFNTFYLVKNKDWTQIAIEVDKTEKSLLERISEERNKLISEIKIWHYINHIAAGLKTMHEKGYAHNSISIYNVYVNKEKKVKIGGFGKV